MTIPEVIEIFSKKCYKILDDEPHIRFAGVINKLHANVSGMVNEKRI